MSAPVIRVAVDGDRTFLAEHDRHVRPDTLRSRIQNRQILIVEDAGVRSGWLRWNLFWDEIPFLNLLFILEPERGRGLGTALMDAWETVLFSDSHPVAMTSTQVDESAQHFYRNRGYIDCGRLLLPDQAPELFFRKELPLSDAVGKQ